MNIEVGGVAVFLPGLVLLGLASGVVAGMFGIGGGWLLVPMLDMVFGIPLPIAVGSSLCQQIGTSIGAFLRHREYGHGEPRVDAVMVVAALLGADAGARLLGLLSAAGTIALAGRRVPAVAIVIPAIYVALLIGVVVVSSLTDRRAEAALAGEGKARPLARLRIPPYVALPRLGRSVSAPVLAYIGFLTGALSGLIGIGGGVALLPILLLGYGFTMKDAAGTGILLLLATVVIGTVEHALHGHVDLRVALAVLAGSSVGLQLGARATARLTNRVLRRWFVALLLITAASIVFDVARKVLG